MSRDLYLLYCTDHGMGSICQVCEMFHGNHMSSSERIIHEIIHLSSMSSRRITQLAKMSVDRSFFIELSADVFKIVL